MDSDKTVYTSSSEETKKFAEEVADYIKTISLEGQALVFCMYGELGSGKTTFVQGLAHGLGIHGRMLSPTFVLMRSYEISLTKQFHHLDLYRLENTDELKTISFDELVTDPQNILVIEWADRLGDLLPEKRINVFCTSRETDHEIAIEYRGITAV